MRKIIAVLLCSLLFLWVPGSLWGYAEILPDRYPDEIDYLEFGDVQALVYNRNDMLLASRNSLYSPGSGGATSALNAVVAGLRAELMKYVLIDPVTMLPELDANGQLQLDPSYDNMPEESIFLLLNTQVMSLQMQIGSISASMSAVSGQMDGASLSVEKAFDSTAAAMESLFITYHNLREQREAVEAQAAILEKSLAISQLQYDLGMNIVVNVWETDSQLRTINQALAKMRDSEATLLRQLNVNIGQDANHPLRLGQVPTIPSYVSGIDWEKDAEDNYEKSYDYRSAVLSEEDRQMDYTQATYKEDMRRLYLALSDIQKELGLASVKQNTALVKFTQAELRHTLGLISDVQYLAEKSAYVEADVAYQSTYNSFYQAYNNYEWARQGLVTGSASGS
jgi:hypothetical protein